VPRASTLAAAAGLAWPVASQLAAMTGHADWMPAITATVALLILLALLFDAASARVRIVLALATIAVALAWQLAPAAMLFVPPAAINVAFGVFFASTLREGREPRTARYARRERGGDLPADLARYTRALTVLWSAWFFAAAVIGLTLAAFAPIEVWSAFANVVSYALVAALFVGEYAYRRRRFAHYAHAPLLALLRIVAQDRPVASRGAPK
jgi:uncharacterized membrane protein